MKRPYIGYSAQQLEAEFVHATSAHDRKCLKLLHYELGYRKTPKAIALRNKTALAISAIDHPVDLFTVDRENPQPPAQSQKSPSRPSSKPSVKTKFRPTQEQDQALTCFSTGGSLRINAYAGSGKTSTLEMLAHGTSKRGQYIAFNRDIVRDAKDRFPSSVNCSTTHGLAFRATPSAYKSIMEKMTGRVSALQLAELLGIGKSWRIDKDHTLLPRSQAFLILETVKRFAQSADAEPLAGHVPRHGSLLAAPQETLDLVSEFAVHGAQHVWSRMQTHNDPLPLGHDGYLKLWALSEPKIAADFILMDEAQDTNPVVLDVLQKQHAQMVYVGDRYQQIYEWRGAVNAMEQIATDHTTYLSRSFRFGHGIAEPASKILSLLGEQKPVVGNPNIRSRVGLVDPKAILARTNGSTITALIESLDIGKAPHLVGGNSELMDMLRGVQELKAGKPSNVADFFGFSDWTQVCEFAKSGEGEHLQTFVNLVESRGERQLMWALGKSVDEDRSNITISTAHKAKGREWTTVRLMDDFMKSHSSKMTNGNENKQSQDPAELRLLYVALTRAKEAVEVPETLAGLLGLSSGQTTAPRMRTAARAPSKPKAQAKISAWAPPESFRPPQTKVRVLEKHPQGNPAAKRKGLFSWLFGK
ncbi:MULTISPECIES: UvrD-helicase domain-containing protein [unclassified Phyllobacterium]|uniref:UvrD-helicase domain-containing protein n=1 Tax=unclassified Phyllobacterium TaxID=2638441 RepID=UPI003012C1F9